MDKPKKPTQRAMIREARIDTITGFVHAHTALERHDRLVVLPSLVRLSDQDLHLLAAAIDNSKGVPHE